MKNKDLILPLLALAIYILGGIGTFGGLALIIFMKGKDFYHWGDGRTVGYLFLFPGLCLSVFGVLLMRITRNRQ
jgi:hypothetical protein